MKIGFTCIEILIVGAILGLLITIGIPGYLRLKRLPDNYRTWCKLTGNKANISYEEWKDYYLDISSDKKDTEYIPIFYSINN